MRKKFSVAFSTICLLGLALVSVANAEDDFYEKDNIRGFVSIGGDYRKLNSTFKNYINTMLFNRNSGNVFIDETTGDTAYVADQSGEDYKKFRNFYFGLHVLVGAQYKQFLTWFDFNFMPTQVSKRPYAKSKQTGYSLYDASWFSYGFDWMFGWKLFGEQFPINLIPAVGVGLNLLNVHFISRYDLPVMGRPLADAEPLRNRYYSTLAATFNSELEFRVTIDPISVGVYGGYRVIRYDEIEISETGGVDDDYIHVGDPSIKGDTYYFGARVTWMFLSKFQKKQRERL
ncbi:MAG: hypothetical protein LBR60_04245 [Fibrobacter sp.]|jgi:hypothetical protein|nr:hypothetical protein [Fibrobacter sp.]